MTQVQILEEIGRLSIPDRLAIIEDALHLIRQDLPPAARQSRKQTDRKRQLATAAKALLTDYVADGELTVFTALDGEDFHAER
jgi:hypothetical protein